MNPLIAFTLCCGALWPSDWIDPGAEDRVAAEVIGNGVLTAAADASGQLISCRWPGPSIAEQLGGKGAGWAVLESGAEGTKTTWLNTLRPSQTGGVPAAAGLVLESRYVTERFEAVTTLLVHATEPLLVAHIAVKKTAIPPQLLWHQDFSPATGVLPGAAMFTAVLAPSRDFAAYRAGESAIVQFRPERCGRAEQERAEDLARGGPGDWERLGEGTWIAADAVGGAVHAYCGPRTDGGDALVSPERARAGAAVAGDAESAFLVTPEQTPAGYRATVYIGFGHDARSARNALSYGTGKGFEALLTECMTASVALTAASPPPSGDAEASWRRDLLCIFAATDRGSGAVIYAPVSRPPLSWVWPRGAAWVGLALERAGQRERAEKNLLFLLDQIGEPPRFELPPGALAVGYYSDGTPAFPGFFVQTEGSAWMISAALRHSQFLEAAAQRQFLERVAAPVGEAADFLASRVHAGTGDLLPEFRPEHLRDGVSQETRLQAWMGLECARRISRAAGIEAAVHWAERERELETQLRFQVLHAEMQETVSPLLIAWLDSLLPDQHGVWDSLRPAQPEGMTLETLLDTEAARAAETAPCNAVSAALRCLAATARVYGQL